MIGSRLHYLVVVHDPTCGCRYCRPHPNPTKSIAAWPGDILTHIKSRCLPHIHTVHKLRFTVRFLRRRDRILPCRDVANCPPPFGDLRIKECLDKGLRRYVRTARAIR